MVRFVGHSPGPRYPVRPGSRTASKRCAGYVSKNKYNGGRRSGTYRVDRRHHAKAIHCTSENRPLEEYPRGDGSLLSQPPLHDAKRHSEERSTDQQADDPRARPGVTRPAPLHGQQDASRCRNDQHRTNVIHLSQLLLQRHGRALPAHWFVE